MEIEIRLYHGLNKYLPPGDGEYSRRLDVSSRATVEQVLGAIGVSRQKGLVLLVQGQIAQWDHVLSPGDVLTAMLPAGGG